MFDRPHLKQQQKIDTWTGYLDQMDAAGTDFIDREYPGGLTTRYTRRQVMEALAAFKGEPPVSWAKPVDEFQPWRGRGYAYRKNRRRWRAQVYHEGACHVGPLRKTERQVKADVREIRMKLLGGNHPKPEPAACEKGHLLTTENVRVYEGGSGGVHTVCRICHRAWSRERRHARGVPGGTPEGGVKIQRNRSGSYSVSVFADGHFEGKGCFATREEAEAVRDRIRNDGIRKAA